MDYKKKAIDLHKKYNGKIEIKTRMSVTTKNDLSAIYTPGVAEVSKKIADNKKRAYDLTMKGDTVAVVSDGSAVLGLGNIGPEAALPVMEGKAVIFKKFAGLNAFPICLDTQDTQEIINTVKYLAPNFSAINLEDISAPRCFEIEKKLQNIGIPVMHDDQHGTAVVVLAALINSLKVVGKKIENIKIIISGAGAAGTAILKILKVAGAKNIFVCDSRGIICMSRPDIVSGSHKREINIITNKNKMCGPCYDLLDGADVFIGVSGPKTFDKKWIKGMNEKPIIFALANPIPEIMPNDAVSGGAYIVATGRSDFPNQINNALAYPGIFRGAVDARAKRITDKMKLSASIAIADLVKRPTKKNILPSILDKTAHIKIASAVKKSAGKK